MYFNTNLVSTLNTIRSRRCRPSNSALKRLSTSVRPRIADPKARATLMLYFNTIWALPSFAEFSAPLWVQAGRSSRLRCPNRPHEQMGSASMTRSLTTLALGNDFDPGRPALGKAFGRQCRDVFQVRLQEKNRIAVGSE